jgi:hypothetical protein
MTGDTQRMAADKTSSGQPASRDQASPPNGLGRIIGARGQEAAPAPKMR